MDEERKKAFLFCILLELAKKAVEPAVKWLQKNGHPHEKIIIEQGSVELVEGKFGFSVEVPD